MFAQLTKTIKPSVTLFQKCCISSTKPDIVKVGLIGCPMHKGQPKSGVRLGPQAIRDGGLKEEIAAFNPYVDILDYGNVEPVWKSLNAPLPENMKNYEDVIATNELVAEQVQKILKEQRMVILMGGDHSLGLGSVGGHLKYNPETVVIWVDAHADLNTNRTSSSGNMHGMPIAMLCKETQPYFTALPGLEWAPKGVTLKNFVYIGLRSVDPGERFLSDKFGLPAFGMRDVDELGIVEVVKRAMKSVDPDNTKDYHISFDIDSIDNAITPSTGTPVNGGLTLREGLYIVEEVFKTKRLKALDLVEVNPELDSLTHSTRTVDAAIKVIMTAVGTDRKGMEPIEPLEPSRKK